tara:strand:- start:2592 stop:3050 length:459 start_codon:yes stop_codon:yes gene_type:complete
MKMSPRAQEIADFLEEMNPDALMYDGFEEALVGYATRCSTLPLALYDRGKCIDILVETGLSHEEAEDYFCFNVEGCWVGPNTPLIASFCLEPMGVRYPMSGLEVATETGNDVEVLIGSHVGGDVPPDTADSGSVGVDSASDSGGPIGSSDES